MRKVSPAAWVCLSALMGVVLGGGTCEHKKRPDLSLSVVPATFTPTTAGNPVAIDVTAFNGGKKISAGFVLTAYLSQNGVIDGSSILLGSSPPQPALLPGASAAVPTWSPTVPGGGTPTLPGAYKLIVVIDSTSLSKESDEANNLGMGTITILAGTGITDLATQSLTLDRTTVTRGQSLVASWNFVNLGDQAGASDNGFYLSTDAIFDGGDVYLGTSVAPNFASGGNYSGSSSLTVPAGTAAGSYYILLALDRLSAVAETDEFNNVIAKPITVTTPVGIDYVVANTNAALTAGRGGTFAVTATAANAGSANAVNPVQVGVYLSTVSLTEITPASTLKIGAGGVGPLNAVISSNLAINVTIPATLATGTYYLGFVIDDQGQETEVDEANNGSSVIAVTVVADDLYEDNDSIATAATVATNTLFSSLSVFAGDDDWYRVTLGGVTNTLTASISNAVPGDAKIEIYNGGGTLIGAGAVTGTGWSGTLAGLPAGNYYLKVYSAGGTVTYNLAASTTSPIMGEGDSGDTAAATAAPAPAPAAATDDTF